MCTLGGAVPYPSGNDQHQNQAGVAPCLDFAQAVCCDADLPPESGQALICCFECAFCANCGG
ncbi:DUF1272 domain-containing protein [Pseudomonas sp. NPDC077408]